MRLAAFIHLEINADCVGALLIFSNIDESKILALMGLLHFRIVCIRNERLASFIFRQRFKKVDDLAQLRWIHRGENLPLIFLLSFRAKVAWHAVALAKAGGISCSGQSLDG